MKRPIFHGWRVVATCFVVAIFAWSLGLFGASVYLQAVTAEHGWAIAVVSSAITLFYLVAAGAQRTVGRSIDRFGPRPVLATGVVSMAIGVALIGQVRAPWQLYPCFVLVGIGWSTLSTTGLSATVAPWFERHQGRSMTLAIMGASVGAMLGVPALLALIGRFGLGGGLGVAGGLTALVLLPLIARTLRYRSPGELGLGRDGESTAPSPASAPASVLPLAQRGRPRVLLWSAAAGFALGLQVQIGFITHHVTLAGPVLGAAGAGALVSATGAAALLGRLILARIVDQVNVRRLAAGAMVAQLLALLAIAWRPEPWVLVAASLVYGYCVGHVTTLGPVVVRREFGAAAFGRTYGSAATLIQFTSATGPALFGIMRDGFGSYRPGLVLAAVITALGCVVLVVGGRLGRPPSPP
jgi:MFS family permease